MTDQESDTRNDIVGDCTGCDAAADAKELAVLDFLRKLGVSRNTIGLVVKRMHDVEAKTGGELGK